jgi:hypothetical protein
MRSRPLPDQGLAFACTVGLTRACARWSAAHSAVADGPLAGLQPLKWGPGTERPASAGLPAGASSAGTLDEADAGAHTQKRDNPSIASWSSIATVENLPTVAPATGAPSGSPAKAGRSVPGPHFSGCRPASGPSATAEWAALQRAHALVSPTVQANARLRSGAYGRQSAHETPWFQASNRLVCRTERPAGVRARGSAVRGPPVLRRIVESWARGDPSPPWREGRGSFAENRVWCGPDPNGRGDWIRTSDPLTPSQVR